MNNEKNVIVRMMDWLVDTLARTLVSLFDGVKNAVDCETREVKTFINFIPGR